MLCSQEDCLSSTVFHGCSCARVIGAIVCHKILLAYTELQRQYVLNDSSVLHLGCLGEDSPNQHSSPKIP